MKCPKCGFVQPDGLEACKKCGIVFAKFLAEPPPHFTIEEADDPPWYKSGLGAAAAAAVLVIGIGFFAFNRHGSPPEKAPPAPVATAEEMPREIPRSSGLRAIDEMCIQNAIQMGTTEVEAKAQCGDQKAQAVLDEGAKEEERLRHPVAPSEIAEMDVVVKGSAAGGAPGEGIVNAAIVLYDKAGTASTTTGKLAIQCTPKCPGYTSATLSPGAFIVGAIEEDEEEVPYLLLQNVPVDLTSVEGERSFRMKVTFNDVSAEGEIPFTRSLTEQLDKRDSPAYRSDEPQDSGDEEPQDTEGEGNN